MNDEWWRGGVIYQIYPRSFQDSSGDGRGDLVGITNRLPYVASLGVDAIWISPFFKSPMKDFGYDVSDYLDVDPTFGTLADFDGLIARAHELGLKVMIDLVLSHTSDQHEWFQNSRQSGDKSDWYVWADPKPDGTPPNNWLSIFGGPAWQWEPKRQQYYLHNFLSEQPDLNFHNPDVQNAILDVARFWLDKGVDGFRLDTINFYFHDQKLRDNPALPKEQRNDNIAPAVNPYNHQDHQFDKNQPENIAFLERLRSLMDEYDGRAAVGEIGDAQYGLEIMADYTSGNSRMHMCYAFDFLSPEPLTAVKTDTVLSEFATKAPNGWPCWALSNHDVVRQATRLETDEGGMPQQKLHAALMLSLRGSACIYQGEELGLREAEVPFELLQDPYGIEFWPEFKGRDGCRTPMVWEKDAPNGGFTSSDPWLPVDPNQLELAVDVQESSNTGLLHFYRQFLRFRKSQDALITGDLTDLRHSGDTLHFTRKNGSTDVHCTFNLSNKPVEIDLPEGSELFLDTGFNTTKSDTKTILPPFGACFAQSGN